MTAEFIVLDFEIDKDGNIVPQSRKEIVEQLQETCGYDGSPDRKLGREEAAKLTEQICANFRWEWLGLDLGIKSVEPAPVEFTVTSCSMHDANGEIIEAEFEPSFTIVESDPELLGLQNAGITISGEPYEPLDLERWQKIFEDAQYDVDRCGPFQKDVSVIHNKWHDAQCVDSTDLQFDKSCPTPVIIQNDDYQAVYDNRWHDSQCVDYKPIYNTEIDISAVKKSEGVYCAVCNEFNEFGEINCDDGQYRCYTHRNNLWA